MSTASSAGHGERDAWLPLVVDCGVCETTHALASGDPRGCPFEGLHRASLAPGPHQPVLPSDTSTGGTDRLTRRFLR
jgi:hypothetical protein